MDAILNKYDILFSEDEVKGEVQKLKEKVSEYKNADVYKQVFSFIDLTTLNHTDTFETVENMCTKVNKLQESYPEMPDVAAVCVYPPFVACAKETLEKDNVGVASVAAGFPSSQTFIDIKMSECMMVVDHGATDVDVVISVGRFLEEDYGTVYSELRQIKESCGDAHLKVILESGSMQDDEQVKMASILAIEAGADFVKTSTGKTDPAATPEAIYVMCRVVKEHFNQTGKRVGIKPAGGIATTEDSLLYYSIVKNVLGDEWLDSKLFRIGASRLANNLMTDIYGSEQKYF
ncbi:MAG: deoxyribose-phosphate aldolase [Bacteroidales bacterium]|jgi:deoxyribose-phosphate aldolase|nr:deoxyribose-phosphate aldolase [Bacteroidales bacterium]